jgi:hypothetical protein
MSYVHGALNLFSLSSFTLMLLEKNRDGGITSQHFISVGRNLPARIDTYQSNLYLLLGWLFFYPLDYAHKKIALY